MKNCGFLCRLLAGGPYPDMDAEHCERCHGRLDPLYTAVARRARQDAFEEAIEVLGLWRELESDCPPPNTDLLVMELKARSILPSSMVWSLGDKP